MIKQGDGGRIINITSVHEDWPMPGNTPYCLSKGGMRMLTRTAGVELAPHNITGRRRRSRRRRHPDQQRRPRPTPRRWRSSTPPSRSGGWPSRARSAAVVAFLAGDGAELPHGHHDLRRRRDHAGQSRPVRVARTSCQERAKNMKDMAWVPGGTFLMGSERLLPGGAPGPRRSPSTASGSTSTR